MVKGALLPLPASCCCSREYGVAVVVGMVTGHYGQYDAFKT